VLVIEISITVGRCRDDKFSFRRCASECIQVVCKQFLRSVNNIADACVVCRCTAGSHRTKQARDSMTFLKKALIKVAGQGAGWR
jgi:hypothetical protein